MRSQLAQLLATLEELTRQQEPDRCKGKPEPAPKAPENKNVARIIRCGGEAVHPGTHQITTDEPLVVISVADLDKFVSACGKVDKV